MFETKRSDAHLVSQVLRGNKELFATLVARYLSAVHAVARANAGTHADTDDIAQETFIDAFQQLDKLREANKFACWLMRIARNKTRDWAGSEMRERARRQAGGEAVQGGRNVPTPEQREVYGILNAELAAMPPDQRETLALYRRLGRRRAAVAYRTKSTGSGQ